MYLILYKVLYNHMQSTWEASTKDLTKASFKEGVEVLSLRLLGFRRV
jgi:hypothetical protein